MKKIRITFVSYYGNEKRIVEHIINNYYNIWAIICDDLQTSSNISFNRNYVKIFWHIESIKFIKLCDGCNQQIANQLGHMYTDGCLSDIHSDPDSVDAHNLILIEKYKT